MTEQNHTDEPGHTHDEACCGHDHDHDHGHDDGGPIVGPGMSSELTDTASRSLADALRWCFFILSGIMVLVLVGFAASGFKSIKTQERGIVTVFGRVVDRELPPGLAWTWPWPIGKIETVSIQPQDLVIEDFWMNETPEDKEKPLSKRLPSPNGLTPVQDGVLLAGDRNLLHVRLSCKYYVSDVLKFKQNVPDGGMIDTHDAGGKPVRIVLEPLRTAVCEAIIRVSSRLTADSIQKNQGDFLAEVKLVAQDQLDHLQSGLTIQSLTIPAESLSWPLAVRPLYEQAQAAAAARDGLINKATADANQQLNKTVGTESRMLLVGDPMAALRATAVEPTTAPVIATSRPANAREENLIGQYNAAREDALAARKAGQKDLEAKYNIEAETLLARIDSILVSNTSTGDVVAVINDAMTRKDAIKRRIEGRAKLFAELQPKYEQYKDLMLRSMWFDARQEILDNPAAMKYYLDTVGGKTVLKLNLDPELMRQVREYLARPEGGAATP